MTRDQIIDHLKGIYTRKNSDYGNSAHHTFVEFGEVALVIRISDKLSRLESLLSGRQQQVNDESVIDTVGDAITYLIMLVAELDTAVDGLDECTNKAREANIARVYQLFEMMRVSGWECTRPAPHGFRDHLLHIWKTPEMISRHDQYLVLADRLLSKYGDMAGR